MENETNETTSETTSVVEITSKQKTEQFSARMFVNDHTVLKLFLADFTTKAEGMQAVVNCLHSNETTITPQTIIETKTIEVEKPLSENEFVLTLPADLAAKLVKLRRYLKENGDIPKESSELEFLMRFTTASFKYMIEKHYKFLNR